MRVHELKIKDVYYDRIMTGHKDFEVRFNDRDYQVNDILVLNPLCEDDSLVQCEPIMRRIKYIHSGLGIKKGYVVLGLTGVLRE